MHEACLICKAPLVYLEADQVMTCYLCHQQKPSKTRCQEGHYVCDTCHTAGIEAIFSICCAETSQDPIAILEQLMTQPFCHMHGPEHHILVGAALLTAYRNAGGTIDLHTALPEMIARGKQIPGGVCGFWGACGAGISTGIYCSIITRATPLETSAWGLSNRMTARALDAIGRHGGPRCCKRDAYLALREAVQFTKEALGIQMKASTPTCTRFHCNQQCLQMACPFYPKSPQK